MRLVEAKRRVLLLDRADVGGTIMHYPRAKVVMTGVLDFAIVGPVKKKVMSKEDLILLWQSIVTKAKLPVKTGVAVEALHPESDGMWRVETTKGTLRSANVLLALGRRGNPRKLEVPGEELSKVSYTLLEPDPFAGKHVLVVGGGNSAVETALSLSDFGRCASVSISYRRGAFARCRAENRRRIDEAIATSAVQALMPSEVLEIHESKVMLKTDAGTKTVQNDAVIVQIGGTAPAELLKTFGIDVVTKRGEA